MKLFGFLFNWRGYSGIGEDGVGRGSGGDPFLVSLQSTPQFSDVSGKQGVAVASALPETWRIVNFRSNKPLAGENPNEEDMFEHDRFMYQVFVRLNRNAGTVIVASRRFSIAEAAVMTVNTYLRPKLVRRNIRVSELSKHFLGLEDRTSYFVTFLSTDVPGYGDSLRSLSLEGEDIAGAGFFKTDRDREMTDAVHSLPYSNFTAKRIGLRPVHSRVECGRFGADNRIEFSDDGIAELETFLLYVNV